MEWIQAENLKIKTLKPELNDMEIKGMERTLAKAFKMSVNKLNDEFGLPYTSSSEFAGIWNAQSKIMYNGLYINGFALTQDATIVMLCHDYDENETYFYLMED